MVEEEAQVIEKPLEGRQIVILYTELELGKLIKILLEWEGGAVVHTIHVSTQYMVDELECLDALIFIITYGDKEELEYLTELKNKYSTSNIITISTLIPEHLRSGFKKLKLRILDASVLVSNLIPALVEEISERKG